MPRQLADGITPRPAPKPSKPPARTPMGSADALSNNPSMRAAAQRQAADPHNWAGIAAALRAQQGGGGGQLSADAAAMRANPAEEMAAINAAVERTAAAKPPPKPILSGSGRTRGYESDGGGGVQALAAPAPVFYSPESISAPPAQVMPPAVIADAGAGASNVAGESFTTVGNPSTFGGYERQRQSRGPRTGMSVTPEMIRRAASQRLG